LRHGAVWLVHLLAALLAAAAVRAGAEEFERVPEARAEDVLPPELVSGPDFRVVDPVRGDGLMRRYVIESRYGRYEAYGRQALQLRKHEIDALGQLSRTPKLSVVLGGLGRGVVSQVDTVASVASHPVATVLGLPRGIAHLFSGYAAEGKELAGAISDPGAKASSAHAGGASAQRAARRYADRYFGISSSERLWYRRLDVDPYTSNATLRQAVHAVARIDAGASFGMRFVALPQIAGAAVARRALDAIEQEDPAVLRARERERLASIGLSAEEIEQWQNSLRLSPTRQTILIALIGDLEGVENRANLVRHATELDSESELDVYLQSVALLSEVHREAPLKEVLGTLRLPTARRADGSVVACGAFEAVYWTQDVAQAEAAIERALESSGGTPRELRLTGSVSPRARAELEGRGWRLSGVPSRAP
jgi:hypothetical protein